MDLRNKVDSLLMNLGGTPDEVASSLHRHNIQGVRNTARYLNPIVRYVQQCLQNEVLEVDVMTSGRVTVRSRDDTAHATIPMSQAVEQFLVGFDKGKYPALEVGEC